MDPRIGLLLLPLWVVLGWRKSLGTILQLDLERTIVVAQIATKASVGLLSLVVVVLDRVHRRRARLAWLSDHFVLLALRLLSSADHATTLVVDRALALWRVNVVVASLAKAITPSQVGQFALLRLSLLLRCPLELFEIV